MSINPSLILSYLQKRNFVVGLFFIILILIGLFVFADYGVSWDEPTERNTGMVNLNYIANALSLIHI